MVQPDGQLGEHFLPVGVGRETVLFDHVLPDGRQLQMTVAAGPELFGRRHRMVRSRGEPDVRTERGGLHISAAKAVLAYLRAMHCASALNNICYVLRFLTSRVSVRGGSFLLYLTVRLATVTAVVTPSRRINHAERTYYLYLIYLYCNVLAYKLYDIIYYRRVLEYYIIYTIGWLPWYIIYRVIY